MKQACGKGHEINQEIFYVSNLLFVNPTINFQS